MYKGMFPMKIFTDKSANFKTLSLGNYIHLAPNKTNISTSLVVISISHKIPAG